MHARESTPSKVLFVSQAAGSWPGLISSLLPPGAELVQSNGSLPTSLSVDAVVLHGSQDGLSADEIERLHGFVEAGGSLLALDALSGDGAGRLEQLIGFRAGPRLPSGEFFARVADSGHELLQRVDREFPIVDSFAPIEGLNQSSTALIHVNVNFQDRVAIAEHQLGNGRVIASSLGAQERAFESAELRTVLRRAIRPRAEGATGRNLRIAIVGYGALGGMGYTHSLAVRSTDGLELSAVCDSNQERLVAATSEFPELRPYQSIDEVAADPAIDLAIVATPPSMHAEHALQLLRAGKHVVCEKPLCFTTGQADQLTALALDSGLLLTVHQNRRWDADFLTIRRLIADGVLGEVFNIETFVGSFEHPCREWHSESSISGGAEFDWGAHYIDWILQLMPGQPALVYANGHKRVWHDVSNLDQVRVRMIWDDGREAEFVHSDVAAVRHPKFYIQGTKGTLVGHYRPLVSERIDPSLGYLREESHHAEAPADLTLVRFEPLGSGLHEQRISLMRSNPFAFHRNLADYLLLNEPLAVDSNQIRNLVTVLEAAHESAAHGGRPSNLS